MLICNQAQRANKSFLLQAVSMDIHPLKFMIPITIAVSFAFMFPVATVSDF